MDIGIIWTIIGAAITTIGTIYTFMRNFKSDINEHIDRIGIRIDRIESRIVEDNTKMDQRVMETNKRMDGVYHLLLKNSEK